MLTFLLSSVVNGSVLLPEYSGIITNFAGSSIVKIADSSPSSIILAKVIKPGEDDPIVPPN
ncbi:hypothetical protein [Planktothrix paucivesiculata]|uniref:Uncharacterized protein n=1 Tax=Planktothrix paucivesiculata PCC 9631 TaxID=671071 RepID=A0A7Z9BLW7_9CYAN|nr:hypothetical protein [Planktothrix paucivesiculata]VXD14488.1 hypothetical protein PL9631_110033 [Planktothrix paucivesiculata PCC 9631]